MEPKHAQRLRAEHPQSIRHKKLHILHIPDNYRYMDPQLQSLLHEKIQPILQLEA